MRATVFSLLILWALIAAVFADIPPPADGQVMCDTAKNRNCLSAVFEEPVVFLSNTENVGIVLPGVDVDFELSVKEGGFGYHPPGLQVSEESSIGWYIEGDPSTDNATGQVSVRFGFDCQKAVPCDSNHEKQNSCTSIDENCTISRYNVPCTSSTSRAAGTSSSRIASLCLPAATTAAVLASVGDRRTGSMLGAFVAVSSVLLALGESQPACGCKPYLKVNLLRPKDPASSAIADSVGREFRCTGGCGLVNLNTKVSHASSPCMVPGRPFRDVEGGVVQAACVGGGGIGDWVAPVPAGVARKRKADAESIARRWRSAALTEHASVASFSRVALELMAAGAPSGLVAAAHEAALDEIRHARTAFAIAKMYGDVETEPGALPLPALVAVSSSPKMIGMRALQEGCIGETVAVAHAQLELRELASEGLDDGVEAEGLRVVFSDEARHAALAWRTLAWALKVEGKAMQEALRSELTELSAQARQPGASGLVGALHRDALNNVVLPWVLALLMSSESAVKEQDPFDFGLLPRPAQAPASAGVGGDVAEAVLRTGEAIHEALAPRTNQAQAAAAPDL